MKRLLIAAASLFLLAGCSDTTPLNPTSGVRISTVGNAFNRVDGVPFLVQNGTSATLEIPACDGQLVLVAEKMEGGAWTPVANTPCPDEFSDAPANLSPGSRAGGEKLITVAGQYRLRLIFTASGANGTNFEVLSNEFVVS